MIKRFLRLFGFYKELREFEFTITHEDVISNKYEYHNNDNCPLSLKLKEKLGIQLHVTISEVYEGEAKPYAKIIGNIDPPFYNQDYEKLKEDFDYIFKSKFVPV